jgi:hypothetical protein
MVAAAGASQSSVQHAVNVTYDKQSPAPIDAGVTGYACCQQFE